MSKFTETDYGSVEEILKFPNHYVALAVMVDDNDVLELNGKKIVPKGSLVGGASAPVLSNLDSEVKNKYKFQVPAKLSWGSAQDKKEITLTAVTPGDDGNSITITVTDPDSISADLTVTVAGTDITVSLATDGSKNLTSTAKEVADKINQTNDAKALVVASYAGDGSGVVASKTQTPLEDGADAEVTGVEGVLMYDVDVTHGPKEGAMIIHGFVAIDKLPYGDQNEIAAKEASKLPTQITFVK